MRPRNEGLAALVLSLIRGMCAEMESTRRGAYIRLPIRSYYTHTDIANPYEQRLSPSAFCGEKYLQFRIRHGVIFFIGVGSHYTTQPKKMRASQ